MNYAYYIVDWTKTGALIYRKIDDKNRQRQQQQHGAGNNLREIITIIGYFVVSRDKYTNACMAEIRSYTKKKANLKKPKREKGTRK